MALVGTRPLLQHNIRLSDPLDPATQGLAKLTGKQKKTLADHEGIADLEFRGSLYHDAEIGPYVKAEAVEKCLREAAALQRLGKAVERGVLVHGAEGVDMLPLLYAGPRSVDELVADQNFRLRSSVGVNQKRTMRTRPRFPGWRLECEVLIDESQLSKEQFLDIAAMAGRMIGLGDYRPRYGRFEIDGT